MASTVTPSEFCEMRVAAIEAAKFTHDGNPRKTFWTALATGTAMDGTFGVVRVRDQHGEEGFIIQQYAGASAGMTLSGDCAPDGYVEAAA